jgi:hypothetical protein
MRTPGTVALVAMLAFSAAACGGKQDAQPAAKSQGQSAGTGGTPQNITEGMQQFAQQVQQMQKGPDGKAYEPVDFKALQAMLPDVPGWEKGNLTGEHMAAPFAHSMASANYTKDDASVEVQIMDSAFNQMALMPVQFLMAAKFAKETASGYEKSQSFGGQPGFVKWDKDAKSGEITVVAAGRFIVNIRGNSIESASALTDVAGRLDFGKLAGLK